MKRLIVFIILHSSFVVLLNDSTQAQWDKPYGSYEWEGAEVQRLTHNTSGNKMVGLCIDKNDKLFVFYNEWWFDPHHQPYRDTLYLMTKEKAGDWSQPERISTPSVELGLSKFVGCDPHTGLIHLFYDRGETLYYTNSNQPNWETVKTDSGPEQAHVGEMAFDSLGNIHLVWNIGFDSIGYHWYRVMYANNSTGQWVKQQVSPPVWLGSYGGTGASSFGVQKDGTVHIIYQGEAYCDLDCVSFYVRNDSLNSSNWITDTIPKPSRPLWHYGPGLLEVDVNDRLHLITGGCIEEDCVWPGLTRTFYYYKQAEDSLWQGPETFPDTTFGSRVRVDQLLIDEEGIPYASYFFSSNEVYFTDRKQRSWEVPYGLVGWHGQTPDSFIVDAFCFVLDSEGKGHGAFSAFNFAQGMLEDDSVEIYYLSSSSSGVDNEEYHEISDFNLFQNYPNPFNSSTIITYECEKAGKVTLKIYDILGREVRELINSSQSPGRYRIVWDGKNNQANEVSSGIYFYLLQGGERKETKKMLLIK